MTETTLATEGDRPYTVRVYTTTTASGSALVRVEWREHGQRKREAKPDSKATRQWAKERARDIAARYQVRLALMRGDLAPQPCYVAGCAAGQVEAHHTDYTKPLEVIWTCRTHHRELDRKRQQSA